MTISSAERMRAMRRRRQEKGMREIRLILPDARSESIRSRLAREVSGLNRVHEDAALDWIENISEFDLNAEG